MKNLGLALAAILLASQAQAQGTHLETGTKFVCAASPDAAFTTTVEVMKELKPEMILDGKFKVKVTKSGPRLGHEVNAITSILYTSDISTRTMAGTYLQVVVHGGKILSLKNLLYSIFKENPVGFYGKEIGLQYGDVSPVQCHFVQN